MLSRLVRAAFFVLFSLLGAASARAGAQVLAPLSKPGTPVVQLAQDGRALLPIVIAPKASDVTRKAAAELVTYLGKISGATFEIKEGDGAKGIVLGTTAEFPDPQSKTALQIRNTFDGREAYVIRTEPNRLLLLGGSDLGAEHAAFRLLEMLGCRWFFPSKEWEVIPKLSRLELKTDEASRPKFLSRHMFYTYGYLTEPGYTREQLPLLRGSEDWARHNLMGQSFVVYDAHNYYNVVLANKAEFDKHPEYYALVNGQRKSWQTCLSNPAVRAMFVKYAVDFFAKYPDKDMVSLEPFDGPQMCECPECAKLGNVSERVFGIANEAARALQKEHPGKMVGLCAYYQHSDPPTFKLEPNVHVQLCDGYNSSVYSFDEQLQLWPKYTSNWGIYEYTSTWAWGQDRIRAPQAAGPAASVSGLAKKIRDFAKAGTTSFEGESSNAWAQNGRGYYVLSKLLWNPDADVDALLTDFYAKAFGPAAVPMRRYFERLDAGNQPLVSPHLLGLAYRDVDEATRLAAGHPEVQARLDHIKQFLQFNRIHMRLAEAVAAKDAAAQKAAALDLITHSWRTRYSFMTHATPVMVSYGLSASKQFNEPNWSYTAKGATQPWRQEPYTHEETEKEFQEGLKAFVPQKLDEKAFSQDLVPVDLPGTLKDPAKLVFYGTKARLALYSLAGEPLRFSVITQPKSKTAEIPAAHCVVTSATGEVLRDERLQLAYGEKASHEMEIKVPKPGLYYADFETVNWTFAIAPNQPVAAVLQPEISLDCYLTGSPFYFYIPKGTRELQYYLNGVAHQLLPPGAAPIPVAANMDYIRVPVPPGANGKAWGISGRVQNIWFLNAPNQLSPSPHTLLVPREVAVQDGLPLRKP